MSGVARRLEKAGRAVTPLAHIVVIALLLAVGAAEAQTTVTLTPVADASIDFVFGNMNLGSQPTLEVGYLSSRQVRRALIRFNLVTGVPAEAVIDSAQLKLYLQGTDGADPASFLAVLVAEDWVESLVTWNNQPNRDQPTVGVTMNGVPGYKNVDVTDIVRAWHNVPHYGLELRGPEGDPVYWRVFSSRENAVTPPQLLVTYHLPAPPTSTRTPTRTVTPIPTPTPGNCVELLINGDFESGGLAHWQPSGNARLAAGRNSATGVVLLGENNAIDAVAQDVGIPSSATLARLDFWWLATGTVDQPNDILIAFALHQTGATELKTVHAVAPFGQWQHETLDVTSYAGRLVGIDFTAYSDTAQPSSFVLDDVSLTACGVPTPTATPTSPPTATATTTPTPTSTPTASPTSTATPSRTPSPTLTGAATSTATRSATTTAPPARTASPTASATPATPTSTPACPVQLGLWINYDGRIPNFPGSPITASAIDGQERVWIGTDGKGIAVFDGVVWQNYTVASTGRGLVSDFVRTIAADGDEIWVGSTAGVSRFNTATNTWTTYTAANSGLPNNIVSAVAFADVGTPPNRTRAQFIATNGGLAQHYYSGGSERWSVVTAANSALLDNRVHDVAVDSSGAFWIVTAGGANKVEDTVWTSYTDSNTAGCGVIQSATHVSVDDAGGRIWFGTDRAGQIDPQPGVGVCMFDTASGTWRRFQSSNSGLADDTVKGMAVDREGRVWFATDPFYPASPGGVSVCTWSGNTCYWKSYGGSTELGTRRTTSATAGGDRVWFGTVNAGLRSFAPNWGRSLAEDVPALAARSGDVWAGKASGLASLHGTQWTNEFSSKPVQAILPIDATDMWAGTDGDGIFRWTGSAWQTLNSGNSSLTDNSVLALARDMAGRTWIGTNSKGLVVYTPRTGWVTFRAEGSPLPSDHVAALVGDNLGRMWVGTDKGLAMYSGSHWASYGTAQGLPSANVRGLAVSPSGDVWVATAAGTVRSDGIGWVAESPPVPVGEPHAVSVDSSGRVWLAGTTGVAVLDGSRWTTYRARNSGLTNDGAEAVVADANGCVWFGTIQREVTGVMLDGGLLVRGNSPAPLGMPVPTVSGFGPATGKINTVVTIYGSNFDTRGVSYNTVEFRAAGFDHWVPASVVGVGATAIAAKVPIAAMRGPIRVRTGGGTAVSSGNFDPLPTITGLGITSGVAGVPVDIVGANFDSPSATVDVRFGNSGWITNITPLQYDHVRVHVPTDATTGPVQIRTSSGTATSPGPFSVSSAGGLLVFGYDATQGLPCFQCVAGKSLAVRVFVSSASASAPAYVSNALLRVWRAGVPLFTVNAGIADGGVPNQGWFKNTTKQVTRDGSIDFFLPGSKLPASASIYTFEVEIYAGPILLAHQHFGNAHTFEDTYPIRIHAAAPGPAPAGQQLTLLARNLAAVDRAFPVRDGYAQQIGGASTGVQVAIQSYNECDGTAMAHCKGTGYAWDFWQQNSNGQARARIEAHAPPRDLTNDGDKVTLRIGTVGKGKSDGVSLLARLRPDSAFPVGTTTLGASMTIDSPDQSGSPDYWSSGFSFQVNRPAPSGSPVAVAAREPPEPGAGAAATPSLSVRAGRLWREPLSAADTGGVLEPGDVILMEILYANVGSADANDTVVVLDYDQAHMVVYGTGGLVRGTGNTIETQMIPGLFWAGTGFTGDRVFDWPLDENYNGVIDVNDLSNFVMEFDHWDPVTGNLSLSTDLSKLAPGDVIRNFLDNNRNGRADAGEPVSAYVKRLENLPQLLFTTPTNFTADYNKTHPAQQADVSALWFWGEGRLSSWPGNSWDVNYILGPGQGNASKQFWSDVPPNSAMVHELGHVFGQVKPYSPHATPASHSTNKHVPVPYAYDLVGKRVLTGQQLLNALFPYVASPVEDTFFEPFEYFDMFINLRNQAKAAAAAASAGIAAAGSPSFYISGTVKEDGTAVVSTSYVADDLAPTPSDENSAYVLRFVAGTQPIREHRFPVTFVEVAQDRDLFLHTAAGSFTVMQPFPAETTAIEIWHNTTRLTRIPVSDSAPWVHLLAPNGAESVDGTGDLVVTWDAGDNDGDRLTYAVRYSADRGSTWHTLMAGATATQLRAPLTMLPGSTNALIEVEASDGVHTATDGSDAPFRVSKKPPLSAQIVAPMSNARLVQSQAVTFAGTSFDPEDGLLPDNALVWNSSLDGPLGHGRSLTTLLSAGRHTITLTATDSDGQPAGASATIDVLADFDNDGLADEYEKGNGLEWWNADDGGADSDSDGLSNRGEADWGTDPHNPDDDGDGVSDGDEVAGGSLPTDSSSAPKPAALMASRTRLDLAVTAGGPNPPPTEILLLSSTPQALDWTATVDAPGLSVRPASGTTPSQVTVTVDVTGLAPGQYDGDLTFRSTTSEQVINVHLEIFTPGLTPTPTPRPTGTLSPRPTPTPTPLGTPAFCPGDCRLDGVVTVDEVLKGVNIALGLVDLGVCPAFDTNRDEQVTVNELLQAVNAALGGC